MLAKQSRRHPGRLARARGERRAKRGYFAERREQIRQYGFDRQGSWPRLYRLRRRLSAWTIARPR